MSSATERTGLLLFRSEHESKPTRRIYRSNPWGGVVVLLLVALASYGFFILGSDTGNAVEKYPFANGYVSSDDDWRFNRLGLAAEHLDEWEARLGTWWKDASAEMGSPAQWINETEAWGSKTASEAKQWEEKEVQQVENATASWWHVGEDWNRLESWFQHEWNATTAEAQTLETETSNEVSKLWNGTASAEREFSQETMDHFHNFGTTMQSWWQHLQIVNETKHLEHEVANETAQVEDAFVHWWKNSRDAEKAEWHNMVHAYHAFTNGTAETEHLWWAATEHAMARDWNATRNWEDQRWNTTKTWFAHKAHTGQEMSQPVEYFNTTAAYRKLMDGYGWVDASRDFFDLTQGWEAQINQAYCAVASVAAVLNSLHIPVHDPVYRPYTYATQQALLNSSCVNDHVVREGRKTLDGNETTYTDGIFLAPGGLNLDQAAALIACHAPDLDVETVHVDWSLPLERMEEEWQTALREPNARVIVNYDRRILGQAGGGHFSPLGAWHHGDKHVLVLDVAKYKYPPAWVSTARLFASMATLDNCGQWDFPQAQDQVPPELLASRKRADYEQALDLLHCEVRPRGYLIVRQV